MLQTCRSFSSLSWACFRLSSSAFRRFEVSRLKKKQKTTILCWKIKSHFLYQFRNNRSHELGFDLVKSQHYALPIERVKVFTDSYNVYTLRDRQSNCNTNLMRRSLCFSRFLFSSCWEWDFKIRFIIAYNTEIGTKNEILPEGWCWFGRPEIRP